MLRCKDSDLGYIPDRAEEQAKKGKSRNTNTFRNSALLSLVEKKLFLGWSPEQISCRLKLENYPLFVSYETIYKFAYSKEGKFLRWPKLLPRKQPTRLKKSDRKPKKNNS
jgi:IS30 family transposase